MATEIPNSRVTAGVMLIQGALSYHSHPTSERPRSQLPVLGQHSGWDSQT